MALTAQQLAALKAAIQADATAGPMRVQGDTASLLAWCNGAKAPAQAAWRVNVGIQDSDEAVDYSTYDTLSAGKRDSWNIFLKFNRSFARTKVRKWITDVWGAATAGSNGAAILAAGTESATNAQVALGGAVKTTDTVSALDRNYTDLVTQSEANQLVN